MLIENEETALSFNFFLSEDLSGEDVFQLLTGFLNMMGEGERDVWALVTERMALTSSFRLSLVFENA